jgi:hypothetical protein
MRREWLGAHESLSDQIIDRRTDSSGAGHFTAEYEGKYLIVFREEDPVGDAHSTPARTELALSSLESRTSSDVVNYCWDSA